MSKTLFAHLVVAFALVAISFRAVPARAEYSNDESPSNDTGLPESQLNEEFEGDVTGSLTNFTNPFGAGGSVNVSYSSGTNETTVEFMASPSGTPVAPGETVDVGLEDGTQTLEMVDKGWIPPSEPEQELPAPDINTTDQSTGTLDTDYAVIDATVTLPSGEHSQEITEEEVAEGHDMEVELSNEAPADGTMTFSNLGFFLSETLIPLDELNRTDYPPSDSMWQPIPGLTNGTQVGEGNSVDSSDIDVPEPASVALVTVGGLLTLRRRRSE